jgi:hypothetical protein
MTLVRRSAIAIKQGRNAGFPIEQEHLYTFVVLNQGVARRSGQS